MCEPQLFPVHSKGRILLFKQGDPVFHTQQGIGVIRSIQEQEIMGSKSLFTTLYFERSGLEVIIPKSTFEQKVRSLMSETKAQGVFTYIDGLHEPTEPLWKARQKQNHGRLAGGDTLELCSVAKSLIRLRRKGPLTAGDQTHLRRSLDMLAEELSAVLGGEMEPMSLRLEQACTASLAAPERPQDDATGLSVA